MFICSVRSTTLKFAAVLCLGVLLVMTLVIVLPAGEPDVRASGNAVSYDRVESAEDMARFLSQFGLRADTTPFSDREITLPRSFDGVFAEYNQLQKRQGLDLAPFSGKKLRKVILRVTDGDGAKEYLATLFLYRGCVVGGDVSSTDPNGEVYGFDRNIK